MTPSNKIFIAGIYVSGSGGLYSDTLKYVVYSIEKLLSDTAIDILCSVPEETNTLKINFLF